MINEHDEEKLHCISAIRHWHEFVFVNKDLEKTKWLNSGNFEEE